jgi:hypothetical protein
MVTIVAFGRVYKQLHSGVRQSVLCRYVWLEFELSRSEGVLTFNLLHKDML